MSMSREGRVTRPETAEATTAETFTGNRGLMLEEPLIFEIGDEETKGVDFAPSTPPLQGRGRGWGLSQPRRFRKHPPPQPLP